MKPALALGVVILISACANVGAPAEKTLHAVWDPSAAKRIFETGKNAIKGNAFLRQQGGGVVTCAGQTVTLIPATSYAIERMSVLYGGGENGYSRGNSTRFNSNPPEYFTMVKSTKCDSQGNFAFDEIADGEYFVVVTVQWQVGYSPQGGNLMQRVLLRGGKQSTIIMSA